MKPRRIATRRLHGCLISVFWGSSERWVAWIHTMDDQHIFASAASYEEAQDLATELVNSHSTERSE